MERLRIVVEWAVRAAAAGIVTGAFPSDVSPDGPPADPAHALDLSALLGQWGTAESSPADLDLNGTVDHDDLIEWMGLVDPCSGLAHTYLDVRRVERPLVTAWPQYATPVPASKTLRLLDWNIERFPGGHGGQEAVHHHLDAVVPIVDAHPAHVFCGQEGLDHFALGYFNEALAAPFPYLISTAYSRSGDLFFDWRNRTPDEPLDDRAVDLYGLRAYQGPSVVPPASSIWAYRETSPTSWRFENFILSRFPPTERSPGVPDVWEIELREREPDGSTVYGRSSRGGLVMRTEPSGDGAALWIVSLHLRWQSGPPASWDRASTMAHLLRQLRVFGADVKKDRIVIAGDFNGMGADIATSPFRNEWEPALRCAGFVNAWTTAVDGIAPSHPSIATIDHVYTANIDRSDIGAIPGSMHSTGEPGEPGYTSDHAALLAELPVPVAGEMPAPLVLAGAAHGAHGRDATVSGRGVTTGRSHELTVGAVHGDMTRAAVAFDLRDAPAGAAIAAARLVFRVCTPATEAVAVRMDVIDPAWTEDELPWAAGGDDELPVDGDPLGVTVLAPMEPGAWTVDLTAAVRRALADGAAEISVRFRLEDEAFGPAGGVAFSLMSRERSPVRADQRPRLEIDWAPSVVP